MTVRYWHDLTTADFGADAMARAVAVLPAGAVEQHGPHLPLGTDVLIARGLAERAAAQVPGDVTALLLPDSAVGWSTEHRDFPGTLTVTPETLIATWRDIGASLARAGVRRLLIANAHGGNVPVMDIVARALRADHGMLVAALSWFDFDLPDGIMDADQAAHDIHGGRLETSVMLHLHPAWVRMDLAQDFASTTRETARARPALFVRGAAGFGWMAGDLNPAGVTGNAAAADAGTGRMIVDHAAAGFAEAITGLAGMAIPHMPRFRH
jgi:creatinine amidohydrolase